MSVVGPGSQTQTEEEVLPLLFGATSAEYVTVLNPLTDDFAVRVAQDVPINIPFEIRKDKSGKTSFITNDEHDARQVYGLSLKNPEHQARKHIAIDTIIPAGKTMTLKGNEAQVAVRQLTHEILQREGNKRLLADPNLRREVEQRIVIARGPIQDILDGNFQTVQVQVENALGKINGASNGPVESKVTSGEVTEGAQSDGTEAPSQERRAPGRPRKDK